MRILKSIYGRIWAFWGLTTFVVTFLIIIIPSLLTALIPDPKGMGYFIKLAKLWMNTWLFLIGCPVTVRGKFHFKKARGYLMKKIKNGVGATKNALKEGVVRGGGLALKEIAERLPHNILAKALTAPYEQIAENAGEKLDIPEPVIDPVKTEKTAVRLATSVVSLLLTVDTMSAPKYEKPKDVNPHDIDN